MDVIRDIRRKEKFQIDDAYLNGYARHCGPMATLVYLSLCRHANSEQQCFPSKKLIGEELNIGERSVYNGLKTLEEWNIIKVEPQERRVQAMQRLYRDEALGFYEIFETVLRDAGLLYQGRVCQAQGGGGVSD